MQPYRIHLEKLRASAVIAFPSDGDDVRTTLNRIAYVDQLLSHAKKVSEHFGGEIALVVDPKYVMYALEHTSFQTIERKHLCLPNKYEQYTMLLEIQLNGKTRTI